MTRIGAIVLAAGESRRMGTQKLLLPFGGQTVIERTVDVLLGCDPAEVIVVVGHDAGEVRTVLGARPITVVLNERYREGMLTSARAGIAAAPPDWDGMLIALGDQPSLAPATVRRLTAHFRERPRRIVVPAFAGRRGHPLLFPATFREEILTRYDDVGLRGLLHAHEDALDVLELDDDSILQDIDYPEDYRRALEVLEKSPNA